jgi:hypothetical protein
MICPHCGEEENFHFNYDYTQKHMLIINVLCNECGEFFNSKEQQKKLITEIMEEDAKDGIYEPWHGIEEEYLKDEYPVFGGPFNNARTPFEWLKKYYHTPISKQATEKVRLNIDIDYSKATLLKIKTRGGFLYRLWFLISAPIIWLIKGEIKIK